MKRIGYTKDRDGKTITLIGAMADCGNVQKAYNKARKCKRYRKDVLIFTKDKEENLDRVRNDILGLAYEPGEYRYFKVYEPKEERLQKSSYKRVYRAGRDTQDTPTATTYERK